MNLSSKGDGSGIRIGVDGVVVVAVAIGRSKFVAADHLDGDPLPSASRNGLVDGGERTSAKFMADVVVCPETFFGRPSSCETEHEAYSIILDGFDTLGGRKLTVIFDATALRLWLSRSKRDLVSVVKQHALVFANLLSIDLDDDEHELQ